MKKYSVNSEELGSEGLEIEAKNLEDAEQKVLDLIDIHEICKHDFIAVNNDNKIECRFCGEAE